MSIEITVPALPESVADAQVLTWRYKVGEAVARDAVVVELETDKVALEITAPSDGQITEIVQPDGATVTAGEVLAKFTAGAAAAAPPQPATQPQPETAAELKPPPQPAAKPPPQNAPTESQSDSQPESQPLNPAARNLVAAHGLELTKITGSGPGGRITKQDVLNFIETQVAPDEPAVPQPQPKTAAESTPPLSPDTTRAETREPMSRLRRAIAARLVQSQQTAALLTTFNEVDMQPVMQLRAKYKDEFEKTHGARLGLMSFFVTASVSALQKFPLLNARIDGDDIVYCNYQDIGIAVASRRGLVAPILRDCARLSFKDIEVQIRDFAARADAGKISLEELNGGTFTITNGGVFGSLLSTPIVNPPQSAILGMHKIQPRPVAVDGEIVIRPMMYLALSYDHRLIDGADAVGFLVAIKHALEQPPQLLLQL